LHVYADQFAMLQHVFKMSVISMHLCFDLCVSWSMDDESIMCWSVHYQKLKQALCIFSIKWC